MDHSHKNHSHKNSQVHNTPNFPRANPNKLKLKCNFVMPLSNKTNWTKLALSHEPKPLAKQFFDHELSGPSFHPNPSPQPL